MNIIDLNNIIDKRLVWVKNRLWKHSVEVDKGCFNEPQLPLIQSSSEKKYNVKFDNDDLNLLNALQDHYGIKNKSDLIELILCTYLKNLFMKKVSQLT